MKSDYVFTAEVTVRTAANFLCIQLNTAALFYYKIKLVVEYYLSFKADDIFDDEGSIQMKVTSVTYSKAKEVEVLLLKQLYLLY